MPSGPRRASNRRRRHHQRQDQRAALADGDRIEAQQRASLEAPAKAEKARTIAEARTIEAQAEAGAIYMKLEAEARGQYEIMAKKADAMRQIVDAAGGAKEAYQLLMLEHLDTLAETSAKAISNIKFDKVVVWDGGNGTTSNFLQNMSKTLPPMMHVLQDIAGVEMPAFLGKLNGNQEAVVLPGEVRTPATIDG